MNCSSFQWRTDAGWKCRYCVSSHCSRHCLACLVLSSRSWALHPLLVLCRDSWLTLGFVLLLFRASVPCFGWHLPRVAPICQTRGRMSKKNITISFDGDRIQVLRLVNPDLHFRATRKLSTGSSLGTQIKFKYPNSDSKKNSSLIWVQIWSWFMFDLSSDSI